MEDTDKQIQQLTINIDESRKNLEKIIAELSANLSVKIAETAAQQKITEKIIAETAAQQKITDAKLKETAQILSNVGLNLGLVAEEFFYHSLKEKKNLGGIRFDKIEMNMKSMNKSVQDEFDIVMFNGNCIALIEIKHKVHPNDLEDLKTRKLKNFKALFPDFSDYKFYLGIGGFSIPYDIEQQANQNGMAVLRQVGETAQINDKNLVAY
jgi:hypothetical protein